MRAFVEEPEGQTARRKSASPAEEREGDLSGQAARERSRARVCVRGEQAGRGSSRRGSPGDYWHAARNAVNPRGTVHTTGTFRTPAESH